MQLVLTLRTQHSSLSFSLPLAMYLSIFFCHQREAKRDRKIKRRSRMVIHTSIHIVLRDVPNPVDREIRLNSIVTQYVIQASVIYVHTYICIYIAVRSAAVEMDGSYARARINFFQSIGLWIDVLMIKHQINN